MGLENETFPSVPAIFIDRYKVLDVQKDQDFYMVISKSEDFPVGIEGENFVKGLTKDCKVLVIKEGFGWVKAIIGPLDEKGFYFFPREEETKSEERIAFSPELEVRLQTIHSTSKSPNPSIDQIPGEEQSVSLIDIKDNDFIRRFESRDKVLVVRKNGKFNFLYGPVRENEVYVQES